jgi:signal transduction histidine kinase/CHASE2 domain-containing sensor protein
MGRAAFFSWRRRRSLHHQLAPILIFAISGAAYWWGALEGFERNLMDARFRLIQRPPSHSLVVVEIDPRSVRELSSWPWPRSYHARLLDNLFAAGARTVGVDIDFSSRSTETADTALAGALDRHPGQVILPAFLHLERDTHGHPTVQQTLPNPAFRERAQLGAVNVSPATDSLVRQFPLGEMFGETPMPSLASRLAGHPDAHPGLFYLDFGIRIRDAPRLSYVDVLNGNFDPKAVAGKNVLIGATAVELGDQFAVPVYRVLPGPILQALGYESLVQHRALRRTGALPSLAITGTILMLLTLLSARWDWRRHVLALAGGWTVLFAAGLATAALAPTIVDLAMPATAALLYCAYGCLRQFEQQARLLLLQRVADTRRRALMQSVLEDSFDGILVADAAGRIQIANRAAGRLLGQSPRTMIGMPVGAFLPGAAPALPAPARERVVDGEMPDDELSIAPMVPVEIELPRANGTLTLEAVLSCSRVPLGGGNGEEDPVFLTYTFRDITERRQSERALQSAMQEALAASRAKTEFLAAMGHELRTPLNAIIGFSEMIEGEVFGALPSPRYREYAGDIGNSGKRLLEVINDILDMAKFESGELRLQEDVVDLAALLDGCVRDARGAAGAAGLALETAIPTNLPHLRGDPRLIRQAIDNVVGNAIKFTPRGGAVRVSAAATASGLAVQVTDNGIGIPPEEIARVVQPFYQVDSELARKYEGTGLGLAIVNGCLRLHQGELTIDSVLDSGTTVTLLFPAARLVDVTAPALAPAEAT